MLPHTIPIGLRLLLSASLRMFLPFQSIFVNFIHYSSKHDLPIAPVTAVSLSKLLVDDAGRHRFEESLAVQCEVPGMESFGEVLGVVEVFMD